MRRSDFTVKMTFFDTGRRATRGRVFSFMANWFWFIKLILSYTLALYPARKNVERYITNVENSNGGRLLSPKTCMAHQDGMYTTAMPIHVGYFPAVSNWL